MNSPKIRNAVLDSNPESRKHLVKLLGTESDLDVVAETAPSSAGIRTVESQKPDAILMDNNDPFTEGLETTEMVVTRFQDARIIVLSLDSSGSTVTASSCRTGVSAEKREAAEREAAGDGSSQPWHQPEAAGPGRARSTVAGLDHVLPADGDPGCDRGTGPVAAAGALQPVAPVEMRLPPRQADDASWVERRAGVAFGDQRARPVVGPAEPPLMHFAMPGI
jgi:CheY-like chemotaxis protein